MPKYLKPGSPSKTNICWNPLYTGLRGHSEGEEVSMEPDSSFTVESCENIPVCFNNSGHQWMISIVYIQMIILFVKYYFNKSGYPSIESTFHHFLFPGLEVNGFLNVFLVVGLK